MSAFGVRDTLNSGGHTPSASGGMAFRRPPWRNRQKITSDMDNNEKKLSIELKPEVARGTYSNLFIVTHSHSEFVLDFASMLPGLPKAEVNSRIIMTPEHAKRFFLALQENLSKYEYANGEISLGEPKASFPVGFGGGNGTKS